MTIATVPRLCKVCGAPVTVRHTIKDIDYYGCDNCKFLQNFYWEDRQAAGVNEQQLVANSDWREKLWPPGERAMMRAKGWEMVELMSSPVAWWSRKVHTMLKHVPGYENYVRSQAKQKLKKLMDFGCGHGVTVFELADEGFDIIGVDPYSPSSDPRIFKKSLYELNYPDNSWDGIFAIETMEHMVDVLPIFAEIRRILKPGAALLVQTRRVEDADYIAQGAAWFYLKEPTMHVAIHSEPAMRIIAAKTGFKEVDFRGVKFARFIK